MTFANRLSQLRKEKGVTQEQLAKILDISAGAIGLYEQGRRTRIDNEKLVKLANYFGVSIDYLYGLEDNNSKPLKQTTTELTPRDERDIAKTIKKTLEQLEYEQEALMFDGAPIDDETKELLKISLENTARMAKKIAKEKYTPKKYRKE